MAQLCCRLSRPGTDTDENRRGFCKSTKMASGAERRWSLSPRMGLVLKAAACVILLFAAGANVTDAQGDGKEAVVKKFFELREQLLDQRGTTGKVDELLALFKAGGHYEHPAFSIIMTMEEARNGMMAHLREGRDAKITIKRFFHGANFTAAETTLNYSLPDESGGMKKIERNSVAIFEFEAGRIARVAEY